MIQATTSCEYKDTVNDNKNFLDLFRTLYLSLGWSAKSKNHQLVICKVHIGLKQYIVSGLHLLNHSSNLQPKLKCGLYFFM